MLSATRFLDPSKDSSKGSTSRGAVEVVRGVFGAVIQEVGRGAGEVERTRARLARLKEEAASARPVVITPDLEAEVNRLRAEFAETKGEAPGERPRVRQRVAEPRRGVQPMPHTAQELWDWMSRKRIDLQELLFGGPQRGLRVDNSVGRRSRTHARRSRQIRNQCRHSFHRRLNQNQGRCPRGWTVIVPKWTSQAGTCAHG